MQAKVYQFYTKWMNKVVVRQYKLNWDIEVRLMCVFLF